VAIRDRPQFDLHLKGKAVDVKQVALELGMRHVLAAARARPATGCMH
jgi:hypothetical protein